MTTKVRKLEPHTAPAPLDTPTDLSARRRARSFGGAQCAAGRHVCALPQDQEFPLARQRPAFPRLPSPARRASRPVSQAAPTFWPNGRARSAAPRSARSAISPSSSASRTTTRTTLRPIDMLRELMNDNKAQIAAHARGPRARRQARGCGDGQPAREFHRRGREAVLVPVRGEPRRRADTGTDRHSTYRAADETGRSHSAKPESVAAPPRCGASPLGLPVQHDPFPRHCPAARDHGGAAHARDRLPLGSRAELRDHRALHDRRGLRGRRRHRPRRPRRSARGTGRPPAAGRVPRPHGAGARRVRLRRRG